MHTAFAATWVTDFKIYPTQDLNLFPSQEPPYFLSVLISLAVPLSDSFLICSILPYPCVKIRMCVSVTLLPWFMEKKGRLLLF